MRKDSGSFPGDQNSVGSEIRETRSVSQCKTILVGAPRFELGTSCAQGSFKKSILLVRLALFYVMVHGFGPNLAVFGPKLDPSFGMNPYSETNSLGTLAVYIRLPYASANLFVLGYLRPVFCSNWYICTDWSSFASVHAGFRALQR